LFLGEGEVHGRDVLRLARAVATCLCTPVDTSQGSAIGVRELRVARRGRPARRFGSAHHRHGATAGPWRSSGPRSTSGTRHRAADRLRRARGAATHRRLARTRAGAGLVGRPHRPRAAGAARMTWRSTPARCSRSPSTAPSGAWCSTRSTATRCGARRRWRSPRRSRPSTGSPTRRSCAPTSRTPSGSRGTTSTSSRSTSAASTAPPRCPHPAGPPHRRDPPRRRRAAAPADPLRHVRPRPDRRRARPRPRRRVDLTRDWRHVAVIPSTTLVHWSNADVEVHRSSWARTTTTCS
jgi:hypothetical protein